MEFETVIIGHVTVEYEVRKITYSDGDIAYDWIADNGDESDETFETAKQAELNVRESLGD